MHLVPGPIYESWEMLVIGWHCPRYKKIMADYFDLIKLMKSKIFSLWTTFKSKYHEHCVNDKINKNNISKFTSLDIDGFENIITSENLVWVSGIYLYYTEIVIQQLFLGMNSIHETLYCSISNLWFYVLNLKTMIRFGLIVHIYIVPSCYTLPNSRSRPCH